MRVRERACMRVSHHIREEEMNSVFHYTRGGMVKHNLKGLFTQHTRGGMVKQEYSHQEICIHYPRGGMVKQE